MKRVVVATLLSLSFTAYPMADASADRGREKHEHEEGDKEDNCVGFVNFCHVEGVAEAIGGMFGGEH